MALKSPTNTFGPSKLLTYSAISSNVLVLADEERERWVANTWTVPMGELTAA
eukprot:CAMPEP_0185258670 /NCGR_PEP_ID=MMETSP1359-20130426/7555_1 /TAXON_ID=552665 /ORGANISM="Bigelowiella longifila, Strain CCMP242" /LENGTH=51 /DNA_ID=CAMNT_0027844253 /DNA_START=524 /DNA_END=679 /DNA_ORIENTATION=-